MIQQNTEEWLELRKSKIGASDAPVILGVSPWKSPYQLWQEKLGLSNDHQMNSSMKRGHDLEPVALEKYNETVGYKLSPTVVFHPKIEWMMASLDGLSEDRKIAVEIKCPGKEDHFIASQGRIPDKYFPQLQHQLAVIGLPMIHYFSFSDENFHLVEVHRDEKYIEHLISEEGAFWNKVQNFECPELTERDFVERNDNNWSYIANQWRKAHERLKKAEHEESLLRQNLISLAEGQSCLGAGIKVQKIIRKGSVDYKSIPELKGVDLDKYRKGVSESWRITK